MRVQRVRQLARWPHGPGNFTQGLLACGEDLVLLQRVCGCGDPITDPDMRLCDECADAEDQPAEAGA